MRTFVDWAAGHTWTCLLIVVSAISVGYVFAHRKTLFYRE